MISVLSCFLCERADTQFILFDYQGSRLLPYPLSHTTARIARGIDNLFINKSAVNGLVCWVILYFAQSFWASSVCQKRM